MILHFYVLKRSIDDDCGATVKEIKMNLFPDDDSQYYIEINRGYWNKNDLYITKDEEVELNKTFGSIDDWDITKKLTCLSAIGSREIYHEVSYSPRRKYEPYKYRGYKISDMLIYVSHDRKYLEWCNSKKPLFDVVALFSGSELS